MNTFIISKKLCQILFICISLVSCASYRKGLIQRYEGGEFRHHLARVCNVDLIVNGTVLDNNIEVQQKYLSFLYERHWIDAIVRAFEDQSIFNPVNIKRGRLGTTSTSNLSFDIFICIDKKYSRIMGLLNVLSLSIAPFQESFTIYITVSIFDKTGKIINRYNQFESVTIWNHFLMVFLMPFTEMNELRDEGAIFSEIYY